MTENDDGWVFEFDLGAVGWREKHDFAVLLDARRLRTLVASAALGSRMHELLTMRRVGDLLHYIDVRQVTLPPRVQTRWNEATKFQRDDDKRLPFEQFDQFFMLMGDDTDPEDEAWRQNWDGPTVLAFLGKLWAGVQHAVNHLLPSDEVAVHEMRLIAEGRHRYEAWPRSTVLNQTRWLTVATAPQFPAAFYYAVSRLLGRPEVEAVSYRGEGDHHLMRLMCNEQRRRADALACPPHTALTLSALSNHQIDNRAWDSELRLYDEGIGWGDLWIETPNELGAPLQELLGTPFQKFGRWVLSLADLGELPGYCRESGSNWTLYEALPGTIMPRPPRTRW